MASQGEITRLLAEVRGGDRAALDRLFTIVYDELRRQAHRELRRRSPGATLSTTALVHETYLKFAEASALDLQDRRHFFAVAGRAMRQIAVDYARRATAQKRGGDVREVTLGNNDIAAPVQPSDLVALEAALSDLVVLDERLARTVELRFFAGLSVDETAELLDVSPRTVKRDWRKARALLSEALGP